jgi:hypothetical protein
MRENQHKYENVIHAQRILDEIAGEEVERVMRSFDAPDQGVKAKRHEHPDHGPMKRSTDAQFATATLGAEEVDPYCDEDADVKGDPKPDTRLHRGEVFMPRAARQSQIACVSFGLCQL